MRVYVTKNYSIFIKQKNNKLNNFSKEDKLSGNYCIDFYNYIKNKDRIKKDYEFKRDFLKLCKINYE